MKSPVKQKPSTLQQAINNAMNGGGGTGGREVPEVKDGDNGKILTATYSEGTGSYAWASAGSFTQVQANWNESDDTEPSYIQNKPTIPAAQVNSDWNAASGVAQILNKPDLSNYATTTDISDMATQTWVGSQGYLTDADGLQVETDGTNYWITVNSIRLYFASSAPTGTIPDGSYGIGW